MPVCTAFTKKKTRSSSLLSSGRCGSPITRLLRQGKHDVDIEIDTGVEWMLNSVEECNGFLLYAMQDHDLSSENIALFSLITVHSFLVAVPRNERAPLSCQPGQCCSEKTIARRPGGVGI